MNAEQLKQKYLVFIKKHNLEPKQCVVTGNAAILLMGRGLKLEIADLSVPPAVFDKLVEAMPFRVTGGLNGRTIMVDDFFITVKDEAEWQSSHNIRDGVATESLAAMRRNNLG